MKKLTLLVAGLAMGLASAFAITPVDGTKTVEFTVPDAWKNVNVNGEYTGWFGTDMTEDMSSFQYCKINMSGNIFSVRFAFAGDIFWIKDGDGTKTDETAYSQEELMNASNADVWFKINNPNGTEVGFHCGDNADGAGSFTVNSVTFYGECENSGAIN
ncbi:MAG: hypothetical protein ILP24_00850, partial [Paludibacteraceae bacterium]|nr:hypothetical protein [Paludibacteraceae bacterium]